VEHVYALIFGVDISIGTRPRTHRALRLAVWLVAWILVGLALLPSLALADSGGATIRRLPDSTQLQASVEIEHQCPSGGSLATCYWFGEASQYPASVECPEVFDDSHFVWDGSVEESAETTSGTFAFTPEAAVVRLCLYVHEEGSSLVGESHPFNTQTGSEALSGPRGRQPTRASLQVRVFDGCKAHVYADARGGGEEERGGSWSDAELRGPGKARLHTASTNQPWFLTVEGPAGSYRVSMRFDGNATLLPSPLATAAFRLGRCTRRQQG
jgi:hypothetical protein